MDGPNIDTTSEFDLEIAPQNVRSREDDPLYVCFFAVVATFNLLLGAISVYIGYSHQDDCPAYPAPAFLFVGGCVACVSSLCKFGHLLALEADKEFVDRQRMFCHTLKPVTMFIIEFGILIWGTVTLLPNVKEWEEDPSKCNEYAFILAVVLIIANWCLFPLFCCFCCWTTCIGIVRFGGVAYGKLQMTTTCAL